MTRHVVAAGFGGPEQLRLVEEPLPEPGPGEVRVAVAAVGVNPFDWKTYSGAFGRDARSLTTFGNELSGTVDAVGEGVGSVAPGTRVTAYGFPAGAYADAVVVPEGRLAVVPEDLSLTWAAAVPQAAGTAWHLLEATGVTPGDTVLVHGGAGGVGTVLVQLARLRGARVLATASPGNHARLAALGADPVAYGPGLLDRVRALAPRGVDVALDTVGSDEALDTSVALVADRARVATIAGFERAPSLGIRLLGNGPGADPGAALRALGRAEVLRLVAEGRVVVEVAGTHPLEQTAEAHARSRAGHVSGKLLVVP